MAPRRWSGARGRGRRRRVVATGGETPVKAAAQDPARATAAVERTDLVDRENLSGTLAYADTGTLASAAAGTLTALRDPGSVVTRGHSLYDVDGVRRVPLYGTLPAWRDFAPGMTDGDDVRQLERNLRALGYDPGDVDRDWDWETTEAVEQVPARPRPRISSRSRAFTPGRPRSATQTTGNSSPLARWIVINRTASSPSDSSAASPSRASARSWSTA